MVVADDAPESLALVRAMFEVVDGVELVGTAADGRQAVDLVEKTHPDLILLDVAMPVMDGLEAAAAIRAKSPEVKIAMYSAYNRDRMAATALAAGADVYVEKAASFDELLEQVHVLFPDRPAPVLRPPSAEPRRRAEPAHEQTVGEQRYRLLLDALEEGVLTVDAAGLVSDANFVATQILKIPVSRMLGRRFGEIGIDGGGQVAPLIEAALRSERPVSNIDCTLTQHDGTRRRLLISVRPLHDPASLTVHETLVSFVDLTAQKQVEQNLLDAHALLDRTQQISKTGGWEYELASGTLVWTDEVYRIYGVQRNCAPYDVPAAIAAYDAESAPIIEAAFGRLVSEAEPFDLDLGLDRADGQRIWVRAIGSAVIEDGHVVRVGGNIADITERKDAEQALADREQQYRRMLETVRQGVWASDADNVTTYVNLKFATMLGYSVDEMIGSSIWDHISPESVADVQAALEARRSGQSSDYRTQLRHKDGSSIWTHISSSPIVNPDGHYDGSLAMISYFADDQHAAEQLAQWNIHRTDLARPTA